MLYLVRIDTSIKYEDILLIVEQVKDLFIKN